MEHLIALLKSAKYRDGVLHGRLVHQHCLEAALKRGVFFDIFAVFVKSGRANTVKLAARQHGLQQIARVHRAARFIRILSRKTKNNPCLIGEPGVGKTAIAEGLALRIVRGDVPSNLKDRKLFSLDIFNSKAPENTRNTAARLFRQSQQQVLYGNVLVLHVLRLLFRLGKGLVKVGKLPLSYS